MRPLTLFFAIGIAMLFSFCSSNKYESRADYSASDSGATMTELSGDSAKLIKSAGMNFKVKDVYKSTIEISSAARSLGGLVLHSTINSVNRKSKDIKLSEDSVLTVSSYYTEASMTVRVPSPDLERFMLQVGSLATFIDQSNMDIDDRSLEFLSQELKYQSRQKII